MILKNRSLITPASLVMIFLLSALLSCTLPGFTPDDETGKLETAVASTLTAMALSSTEVPQSTPIATDSDPETVEPNPTPTQEVTVTPTHTPPPSGLSYECDDTYQRTQLVDLGDEGKILIVENWDDAEWVEVWRHEESDPMISQIEADAGPHIFGECQYLVALPIRFSGSGANLALSFFRWNGVTMEQVYFHEGVHGDWSKVGSTITFQESVYLYGEANCCPCNRQFLEHTWDGEEFSQTGSLVEPTYEGDPPEYCQP